MENGKKSAFTILDPNGYHEPEPGLTKREYFAGLAMQAIISNQELRHDMLKDMKLDGTNNDNYVAFHAVRYADELLKQLES